MEVALNEREHQFGIGHGFVGFGLVEGFEPGDETVDEAGREYVFSFENLAPAGELLGRGGAVDGELF